MKLGEHIIKPIAFPGDERGYLPGNSGTPGSLCGFFVPGIQVYQCTICNEMFQPVAESRYDIPSDPATTEYIRTPWSCTTRNLINTHPIWICKQAH